MNTLIGSTQELLPGDNPNDPRKHFVPTPLFQRLWQLEEKWNAYNNDKMDFIARIVEDKIDDESKKLIDKHFPELIKKTFWQKLKELFN